MITETNADPVTLTILHFLPSRITFNVKHIFHHVCKFGPLGNPEPWNPVFMLWEWKQSVITPDHKKGPTLVISNYQPINHMHCSWDYEKDQKVRIADCLIYLRILVLGNMTSHILPRVSPIIWISQSGSRPKLDRKWHQSHSIFLQTHSIMWNVMI